MHITGIILAAGTSSRMGSKNKLLLPYKNRTVIEETFLQLSDSDVDDIIVVTGHEHELIEEHLTDHLNDRTRIVHNPEYMQGRAESIKCAIRNMPDTTDAALFMVADKPEIESDLINRAIELYKAKSRAIVYVQTPSGRGHPIIFAKRVFDDLLAMEGDVVGDAVVTRYKHDTSVLRDNNEQIDIDTEYDYRILLEDEDRQ